MKKEREELEHCFIQKAYDFSIFLLALIEKAKELYDSVFDGRNFLIKDQPEYFYRSYIQFLEQYRLDLTPAIRCFVENKNEFKDVFIYMAIEMDLNFAAT